MSICDSLVGVDKPCIFAVFQGILVLWETIYAKIIILLSTLPRILALGMVYYLSMLPGHKNQMPRHRATRILLYFIDLITL